MYAGGLLAALALTVAPVFAIPPENFGFPSAPNDTALTVSFRQSNGSSITVTEADEFGVNITKNQPTVSVNTRAYQSLANYTGQYVVMMVDPDAPTPQNASRRFILHWLQPYSAPQNSSNGVRELRNQSATGVPYAPPAPGNTSDAHRYIIYAFQQPPNFTIPLAFRGYSATNRTNFNLTQFISAAYLGQPAAAEYFYVSAKTGVPVNFTAPAGSSYPGGNGVQITQGTAAPTQPATATRTSATVTGTNAAARLDNAWAPLAGLLGVAAFVL